MKRKTVDYIGVEELEEDEQLSRAADAAALDISWALCSILLWLREPRPLPRAISAVPSPGARLLPITLDRYDDCSRSNSKCCFNNYKYKLSFASTRSTCGGWSNITNIVYLKDCVGLIFLVTYEFLNKLRFIPTGLRESPDISTTKLGRMKFRTGIFHATLMNTTVCTFRTVYPCICRYLNPTKIVIT